MSKQVNDQDAEIKALKLELYEIANVQVKSLRKEIDDLFNSNDEKEKAIKKLEEDFIELENNIEFEDNVDDGGEDEKETNSNEKEEVKHPLYVQNALDYTEYSLIVIENVRKNSEAKSIVQDLSKKLMDVAILNVYTYSEVFQTAVNRIKSFSKSTEAKVDKESCRLEILRCEKEL